MGNIPDTVPVTIVDMTVEAVKKQLNDTNDSLVGFCGKTESAKSRDGIW